MIRIENEKLSEIIETLQEEKRKRENELKDLVLSIPINKTISDDLGLIYQIKGKKTEIELIKELINDIGSV